MKDKDQIAWYYRSIAEALKSELGETLAWQEYRGLVEETFGRGGDEDYGVMASAEAAGPEG